MFGETSGRAPQETVRVFANFGYFRVYHDVVRWERELWWRQVDLRMVGFGWSLNEERCVSSIAGDVQRLVRAKGATSTDRLPRSREVQDRYVKRLVCWSTSGLPLSCKKPEACSNGTSPGSVGILDAVDGAIDCHQGARVELA